MDDWNGMIDSSAYALPWVVELYSVEGADVVGCGSLSCVVRAYRVYATRQRAREMMIPLSPCPPSLSLTHARSTHRQTDKPQASSNGDDGGERGGADGGPAGGDVPGRHHQGAGMCVGRCVGVRMGGGRRVDV